MNDYYTHREYLNNELSKLDFSKKIKCLEFGTGEGSAFIFKEYVEKYSNLQLTSYESEQGWLNNMNEKYSCENWKFNKANWIELLNEDNFKDSYDLVFVDQSPWEARIKTIDILRKKAKVIILHDYDFYNKGVINDIYSIGEGSFFHKMFSNDFDMITYHEILPPTLVMYNKNLS